ncbi:aminoglycoside phosphotransferase family protein [Arachnia propionica]|uniref:Aminoglycoside phosphotransferase family protein n=1 Tax=Arachnia propionica TaxID=1750 RepID=A0A3P1WY23_9ACTN|nr:aminoglycoside phosphotransferase family protein [Arachnia propionica]RRD49303.1 aminoglycoside phosphotransferase family protein [Arachnia propionica]
MDRQLSDLLERILDPSWLSEHAGRDVRAARVRIKPSTSLGIALADGASGRSIGWMRVLWPVNHGKAEAAVRDAARHGQTVEVRDLGEGLLSVTGPVMADPKLWRHLRDATRAGLLGGWASEDLLRYNPLRRVVIRDADRVVRVVAGGSRDDHEIQDLVAGIVPCPERLDDGSVPGCSVHHFTGEGDLEGFPSAMGAEAAGELVARLHAAPLPSGPMRGLLDRRNSDPVRQAHRHAALLDHVAPELAVPVREAAARLTLGDPTTPVLCHGDLSPDQVLTVADGSRVWLTDFDRAQSGAPSQDLGSFIAEASPELAEAFMAGYAAAGGAVPEREELALHVAASRMHRLMDPLRRACPDWRIQVGERLALLEGTLP